MHNAEWPSDYANLIERDSRGAINPLLGAHKTNRNSSVQGGALPKVVPEHCVRPGRYFHQPLSRKSAQRLGVESETQHHDLHLTSFLRIFVRHIVSDTFEYLARIFASKFLAMRRSIRGPTLKIAGNGDCMHGDNGPFEKVSVPGRRTTTRSSPGLTASGN